MYNIFCVQSEDEKISKFQSAMGFKGITNNMYLYVYTSNSRICYQVSNDEKHKFKNSFTISKAILHDKIHYIVGNKRQTENHWSGQSVSYVQCV